MGKINISNTVSKTVSGLFAPRYIFAPRSESSQWEPNSPQERKFPGTFAPGNECSRELSFPGANVPGNIRSWYSQFAF